MVCMDRSPTLASLPPPADPEPTPPARKRGAGRRWEPGQSGNPSGRPRQDAKTKAALEAGAAEGAEALLAMLRDPRTGKETRRKIAEYFLDRRFGRPTQAIGLPDTPPAPGASANDSPLARLLTLVRARRTQPAQDGPSQLSDGQDSGDAPSASPGAADAATDTLSAPVASEMPPAPGAA